MTHIEAGNRNMGDEPGLAALEEDDIPDDLEILWIEYQQAQERYLKALEIRHERTR